MHRLGAVKAYFHCQRCHYSIRAHVVQTLNASDPRSDNQAHGRWHDSSWNVRVSKIKQMIAEGYPSAQIARQLKCHEGTVRKLRPGIEARKCECGWLYYHAKKCKHRPGWQSVVRERREMFDQLLVDINRRVHRGFPSEMRDDICQEVFLDIQKDIKKRLADIPKYVSAYRRNYPFQMFSIDDADNRLAERLVG